MSRAERAHIEAADWLIAQADGPLSAEDRARFDAWLSASEGNRAAYWRLEFGWDEAGRINASGDRDDGLAERARWRRPQLWIPAAIAASLILAIGLQQWGPWAERGQVDIASPAPTSPTFATAVGESRRLTLPDGSRIELNTLSQVRTRIDDERREVWLDAGEVFFAVAPREDRPFVVHAGDRKITVLGTEFSVRRRGGQVTVAVVEGRVQLDELKDGSSIRSSIITAGDMALASGSATLVTTRSDEDVAQALAWRDGMLSFDQEPLSTITAEFNRYNARKLTLGERSVGSILITGTFPSDKPDAFARLLEEAYGLRVDEQGNEIRIHR
jgi:transmembrane sensor